MGVARVGAVGLLALAAIGCSTTATVVRRDGTELEGTINGGTPTGVVVTTEDGQGAHIPRDDIREIDHPGNVHAIAGGLFVLLSGMMLVGQSESCDRNPSGECWAFLIPGAIGTTLLIWGIPVWRSSVDAAGQSSMRLHPRDDRPRQGAEQPAPSGELPPQSPAPPGYVGPAPSGAAPAPSAAPAPAAPAPVPSAPPPAPPAEPDGGAVVW
jgi:hypothetical protein